MEIPMKVLIVGNGAVGKSSMMQRYCKGSYTNDYKKTIGVDFLEKKISIGHEDLRLMIWDTAGQDEFSSLTRSYYAGAHACVIAFSTTDRASFDAVEGWISKVQSEVEGIPMALVQNKVDLIEEALMTNEEAENLAKRVNLVFFRTSVRENFKVDEVFHHLATQYLKQIETEKAEAKTSGKAAFGQVAPTSASGSKSKFQAGGAIKLDVPSKGRTTAKKKKGCKDCN